MKNKTKKHLFKAGNYVIGDPCYFIADENWDKVLEDTGFFGAPMVDAKPPKDWDEGLYHYKGLKCFAHDTAWGDGEYICPLLKESVWVDSGVIGIMPIQACDMFPDGHKGYIIHKFIRNFSVWEKNGIFHFGIYDIDTN